MGPIPKEPLGALIPTLIVVDRKRHLMEVWRKQPLTRYYKRKCTYPVTTGKQGHETPHGLYFVNSKSRKPNWRVPRDPDYDQRLWGTILHYGQPGNPFDGAFISLAGKESGIGLHGTSFDPKVGTSSSHGCIRMRTPDVLEIYKWCKVGTPVYLH